MRIGDALMISKWFRTALAVAVVTPLSVHAQIGLSVDTQVLFPLAGENSDLDAPGYVIDAGFAGTGGSAAIRYEPSSARLVMQTRFADLTCEYFDAAGLPVAPPGGAFTVELDRIPTPPGGQDPNVDFNGDPIAREFALDVAAGASITQMFLPQGNLLDICSSAAACIEPPGVHLRCRPAGTAVFNGDFEAPTLSLLGSATASSPTVVAGNGNFELQFTVENSGDLDAPDLVMLVGLDALPAGVTSTGKAVPSRGTYDSGSGLWDIGLLESGQPATLTFGFAASAAAPDGLDYCGAMALDSVNGDPINPAAADAVVCVDLVRWVDLKTAALEDPETVDPVDITAGDVSYSYIFSLENVGPSDASGVAMELDLQFPVGVVLDQVVPFSGSYDAQTGIWTIGPMFAGSLDRRIRVDVTVTQGTTPGTDVVCAGLLLNAINEQRINPGDDEIQECTSVIGPPTVDLVAAIELSNATPVAGSGNGNLELIHRITNNTAIEATGIQATVDAVSTPGGVSMDSEVVASGTQLTGTLWEIPSLAAGASVEIRRIFTVNPSALSGDQVCAGLGNLSASEDLIVTTDDSDSGCASITRQVDIVVQVANNAATVQPGAPAGTPSYQFLVQNLGPSNASGLDLQLTELLPAEVTRGAPSILFGSFSGMTWTVGNLNAGQQGVTLTLSYTVGSAATPGDSIEAALAVQTVSTGETLINTGDDQVSTSSTIVAP